jgi:hypothetical protein
VCSPVISSRMIRLSLFIFILVSLCETTALVGKRKRENKPLIQTVMDYLRVDPNTPMETIAEMVPEFSLSEIQNMVEGKRAYFKLPLWFHAAISFTPESDPRFLEAMDRFETYLRERGSTSEIISLVVAAWLTRCVEPLKEYLRNPSRTRKPPCYLSTDKSSFVLSREARSRVTALTDLD